MVKQVWDYLPEQGRRFWQVAIFTLLAATVGAVAGFWQALASPPRYQVEIVLAVYPAHYQWNLDPRIQSLNRNRPDARYLTMVMAEGANVLNEVIRRMGEALPEEMRTRKVLERHLDITSGQGVYVYLKASASDPELAQELAATWAQVVKEEADRTFFRYEGDIPLLEGPLQETRQRLLEAEAALEAFRRETGIGIVDESRVAIIVSDRRGLSPGIAGFSSRAMELGNTNGQLALYRHAQAILRQLAEQVREARAAGRPISTVPLELIVDLEPITRRGVLTLEKLRAMGDDYDAVLRALEAESEALQPAIDLLAADANRLQAQMSADITRLRELIRQRSSVEDLYNALVRKQNELRAEEAISSTYVQVVEVGEPKPAGLIRLLRQAVIGGVLGGLLGFALAATWLYLPRRGREQVSWTPTSD